MAADEKWYFTKEQLANTPSRKCGIDADKELSYRQQAANFIQDMGQRLVVYPFYKVITSTSESLARASHASLSLPPPRPLLHVFSVGLLPGPLYPDMTQGLDSLSTGVAAWPGARGWVDVTRARCHCSETRAEVTRHSRA